MNRSLRRVFLLTLGAVLFTWAADAPNPAKAGMDPQVLTRIPARMKTFVDQGLVSGVVTLVQRHGAVAEFDAVGYQDADAKTPMRTDSIFQIMSMTKPFTGVAIMMLAEEGKLRLNDPVERHLPEFRGLWLAETKTETSEVLRKPARAITIRDLMTHTSGMSRAQPPATADLLTTMDRTLADAVLVYSQQPLEFDPGTHWMYSNPGIATLGRIVEVVGDMPFDRFVTTRILEPLGMKDTHFALPGEKHNRLAPIFTVKDGHLIKAKDGLLGGDPQKFRSGAKYSGPEYSLYSTAGDLAQFYQMMLNKGTLHGKRLLSPASVETMSALHTGDLKAGHSPGTGYGLTWEVTKDPIGTLTGQSVGSYGHGGAYGTYGWIDPSKDLVEVFMIQFFGNRNDARDAFLEIATAAVVE
jgi:CubicO group peptidase (beta-lactamase class C family)